MTHSHDVREYLSSRRSLSTRSEEFRTRWARHDMKHHRTGRKRL